MLRVPRWIIVTVFLFTCMFLSWYVYDRYNNKPSLRQVASVLTEFTEQDTQGKQARIREYLLRSNRCLGHSDSSDVIVTNNEMRNLVTLLDGAEYFFKKMKSEAGNRLAAEKTFTQYQEYIAKNMSILEKHSQAASKTILNEYLQLNDQLLPKENTTKGKSAVEISVVILERALTDHIYFSMNKLAENIGGCED